MQTMGQKGYDARDVVLLHPMSSVDQCYAYWRREFRPTDFLAWKMNSQCYSLFTVSVHRVAMLAYKGTHRQYENPSSSQK